MPRARETDTERFPEYVYLARNLVELRRMRGLSQLELAEKLDGIDQGYISNLEKMKTNPTLEALSRLAAGLSVTMADLVSKDLDVSEVKRPRKKRVLTKPQGPASAVKTPTPSRKKRGVTKTQEP